MDEKVNLLRASSAPIGAVVTPAEAMRWALREGRKGTGYVSPNPLVGCAIVDRSGRLLAVGHHARLGGDHAEIHALKNVSDPAQLVGAHWYVTLEPCAHEGRTPSCARALAKLAPASVTYAVEDPNPLVAGKGALILREAGIRADLLSSREDIPVGERERLVARAEELAEIFLYNQRAHLPFVAVKIAASLDGQSGLRNGESQWITGERARQHTHAVRARYDAMLIGAGTFAHDNPSLNIRHSRFPGLENRVVVVDPTGACLPRLSGSNLLKVRAAQNVLVAVGESVRSADATQGAALGISLLRVRETSSGVFDVHDLCRQIRDRGVQSVMIEGGPKTIASFLSAGLVCRLHVYSAPLLIGAATGRAWTEGFGVASLARAVRLDGVRYKRLGRDLYCTGRVSGPGDSERSE